MSEPTIHLFTNTLGERAPIGVWPARVVGWRQKWTAGVGPDNATFSMSGSGVVELFYGGLGYHVEARVDGLVIWEGMLYEMDLHAGAIARRRSLGDVYNHVRTAYVDENNISQMSAAVVNSESWARYGQKEEILTLDGYTADAASAYAATFLRRHAYPWARPAGSAQGDMRLNLTAVGYAYTANWRYISVGNGSLGSISDWVAEILGADVQYASRVVAQANSLSVAKLLQTQRRAGEYLAELADLGDSSYHSWELYWETGRTVHYRQVNTAVRYVMATDGTLRMYPSGARVNPWLVRPAVMRDAFYLVRVAETGGWLDDPRDAYLNSVAVDSAGGLSLSFGDYDDLAVINAQASFARSHAEKELRDAAESEKPQMQNSIWQLIGLSRAEYRMLKSSGEWQRTKRAAIRAKLETGSYKNYRDYLDG